MNRFERRYLDSVRAVVKAQETETSTRGLWKVRMNAERDMLRSDVLLGLGMDEEAVDNMIALENIYEMGLPEHEIFRD